MTNINNSIKKTTYQKPQFNIVSNNNVTIMDTRQKDPQNITNERSNKKHQNEKKKKKQSRTSNEENDRATLDKLFTKKKTS